MNISSIIVQTNDLESTAFALEHLDNVEVYYKQGSFIIVVIEASETKQEIEILNKIERTQGVISASLHYSYFEDELSKEIEHMNNSSKDLLNNDNCDITKLKYYGDVNTFLK